jgi:hypothetical protein
MFLMAVEQFLKVQLSWSEDMVQDLLTAPNKVALVMALDRDGNGKVCAVLWTANGPWIACLLATQGVGVGGMLQR